MFPQPFKSSKFSSSSEKLKMNKLKLRVSPGGADDMTILQHRLITNGCPRPEYVKLINLSCAEILFKSFKDREKAERVFRRNRIPFDWVYDWDPKDPSSYKATSHHSLNSSFSSLNLKPNSIDHPPSKEKENDTKESPKTWAEAHIGSLVYICQKGSIYEKCKHCKESPSLKHLHMSSDCKLFVDPTDTIPQLEGVSVSCKNCQSTGKLFQCSSLCPTPYCSQICQVQHRLVHRPNCLAVSRPSSSSSADEN